MTTPTDFSTDFPNDYSGRTPPNPPISPDAPRFRVSATVVDLLRQTKPWVRFLSILAYILGGLMVLLGFGAMLMGIVTQQFMVAGVGFLYLLMALLYILPAMFLSQYAARIGDLLRTGAEQDLEEALDRQRAFWKFVGIMMVVMLCLYPIIFVFAIIAGGLSGMAP